MNLPLHLINLHSADITLVRDIHPDAVILVAHNTPGFRLIGESGAVTLEDFQSCFKRELEQPAQMGNRALRSQTVLGRQMFLDHRGEVVAFEVRDEDAQQNTTQTVS